MKKSMVTAGCCALAALFITVGGWQAPVAGAADTTDAFRTVTDLQGNRVRLPPAKDLHRVVIIAPPLVSWFASFRLPHTEIVGANSIAFVDVNTKLLDHILPQWRSIPTGFLTGFRSNTEELLRLKPDVILVYGNFQKEGLEAVPIPVLDFYLGNHDNEVASVARTKLMREIFAPADSVSDLQHEWDQAKKQASELLAKRNGPRKKGMMISSNTGDTIMVLGLHSCGDDWLKKSGLSNVANVPDSQGAGREITMEQLYAWNPDIIYVFRGIPAADYLKGNIAGQDWRPIKAVRNGAVYDMPLGLANWGAPNPDSPLTLLWMIGTAYPEVMGEVDFADLMKAYYARRYGIALNEELIETTLYPHGNKKK